jgi:hypothetical protein
MVHAAAEPARREATATENFMVVDGWWLGERFE